MAGVDAPLSPPAASEGRLHRGRVVAWSLWDWGASSLSAVATSFVFTVYLTDSAGFGGEDLVSAQLGWALGIAGVIVLLLAPVLGQRTDRGGSRRGWLAVTTLIVVACLAAMVFVRPERAFLPLGLLLLAVGTVVYEIAAVNYNAMLAQVSTKRTLGAVSGFGWGMGYLGGIVLLVIVYFGFIHPDVGLFGITDADGLSVRVSMVVAAIWFAVFAIPVLVAVPDLAPVDRRRVGFLESYAELGRDIRRLYREGRNTLGFLVASAVFRDGLTGVFTFGGVLAAGTFGFSPGQVIVFGIVANVVAGIATIGVGALDDRLGPKRVILASLIGMLVCGLAVLVFHDGGQVIFWTFGLALAIFVGPAQSASRSFLSRLIPAGREGEIFGLYATTGRAATFLAPTLFGLAVSLGGAQYWGILGILVVLAAGLALLVPVKRPA